MELKSGTYLQGDKYRIERSLGQGGFGITYLAEHELAGRMVCIKEFFPKSFYNRDADSSHVSLGSQGSAEMMDAYKQKFLKEARTIARLDHQNIIHIHDVFQENGTAYYVMEYIEGESLQDIVRRRGALPAEEALALMNPVIDAVGYIHDRRIMHLDIKPGNIMVRKEDGRPILIDFGLSKQYDEEGNQTSSTPVGISHGFAPIEQYQMGGVSAFSPQTDIYSLGATLYYLVSGTVPPQAAIIINDGLPALPNTVGDNVREAIEKSMQFVSRQRPESIAILKQLLGNKVASAPASAQPSADTVIDIVADNSATQIDGGATQIDAPKDDATQIDAPKADATQIDGGSETAIEPKPQPEPKVAPKPEPKVSPKPEPKSVSASKPAEPKKKSKWWLWLLLLIVAGGVAAWFMSIQKDEPTTTTAPSHSRNNYTESGGSYCINMKMVWVEGGTFQMGSTSGDSFEQPIHDVILSGYWIAETEVTQAQWEAVMGTTVRQQRDLENRSLPLRGEGPDNPIYYVNYDEAKEFCRRLSAATGRTYTLPTEAQWEYAARGGNRANGTIFTYSGSNTIGNVAWYIDNSGSQTHPVKQKTANQLGLYDMSGNVNEWCLDWCSSYSSDSQTNPQGPSSGQYRVLRGGNWDDGASLCKITYRNGCTPWGRRSGLGFRVVCLP